MYVYLKYATVVQRSWSIIIHRDEVGCKIMIKKIKKMKVQY